MNKKLLASLLAVIFVLGNVYTSILAVYVPGMPPEIDPGTPVFSGLANPVPAEPASYDPATSMLQAIYDADLAAGGTSFWIDRILEQPGTTGGSYLWTRGRALYMYRHTVRTLGFAGGYAYRERPTGRSQNMYTITVSDVTLSESTGSRRQYPSHWSSVHTATGLSIAQKKFITYNNVAVTILTITNTNGSSTTQTLTVASPIATVASADGSELTGAVTIRYGLTTIYPRLSGDGFTVSGSNLTRSVTLGAGESITLKVQMGVIADEIPESAIDYQRFRDYDPETAFLTHLREYNQWWAENVPYIDIPDQNVKKMSYYHTFLNRYNYFDGNIPGNDYQYPVSIEGVLGYNNAIQLTQPMHLQDLKYFRDPIYSYGNWVSSGETSKCHAFSDNPGGYSWGNTYEQYIAREAWNAYKVHGGDPGIIRNFAYYAECDVKGQLDKYDTNGNYLIEYQRGYLTGNDADATPFYWASGSQGSPANRQDRAEAAFQYAGAKAAAEAYALLGEDAKAAEMNELAENIKNDILTLLWDDSPIEVPPPIPVPATRSPGQEGFGNAIRLNGPEPNQYVELPTGIVNGLTDFTIATWVNRATTSGQTWARIFDFGTGTPVNMFLTVNAGGAGLRFAITTSGSGGEQQITAAPQLPTGWQHVAVTLSGTTGTLYLNGSPVDTNDNITLNPSSLGNTTQNWIGRSQYDDPLLDATVDEFQIYDYALTQAQIQSLMASPGGELGGGNVAWYRFDEDEGEVAFDSSGNNRHATVITPLEVVARPGHVFKHRLVSTGELIPWKDQQNFAPFIEGIPPTDDLKYREALRYYADAAEFPIMPFYTANQRDKAEAAAMGRGGTNNFSNINSTLQAQTFIRAITEYPSEYITPDMFRLLLEWLTWVNYIGGDNRYPDNNEYFYNWNATNQTLSRSGIHHNILGAYNFMIIDGIAGVRPRLDDVLELWPIDVGWDYFTINNLSYHGQDLTLVWDRPGAGPHYGGGVPQGLSVYLNGQRVFTVDDLVHVTWDAKTGVVTVLDGSDANVLFSIASPLPQATEISLADNARIVDMFQKAGRDLTLETGWAVNLAEGKPVSASFTTTSPATRATAPENAVDGFTVSGLPAFAGGNNYSRPDFVAPNTIWGTEGSPNSQDWFEVDLGAPTSFDTVKLYFFNDKNYSTQQNCTAASCGNAYREPSTYTVEYYNGTEWVRVPEQYKSTLLANYNQDQFNAVTAQRMRVRMTPRPGYGIGLKEIQVFYTGIVLPPMENQPPVVNASQSTTFRFPLKAAVIGTVTDDELIFEFPEVAWSMKEGPGLVSFAEPDKLITMATFSAPGTYILTLSAYDGEFTSSADLTVVVDPLPADINLATLATPSTSYVSPWENLFAINDGYEPSNSRDKGPGAYGNWNASGPTQWVQYTWPEEVVVDRSDVYWWTDGGGIQMPTASSLDYWDGSDWVPVPSGAGFGVLPDRYNTTTFDPVKTDRVRMTITRGTRWTGILEWKVFQAPVQSVVPVEITTLDRNLPVMPPTVTAEFLNNITLEKNVIWDEVTDEQVQIGGTSFAVSGAVDISHVPATATVYVEAALVSNNLATQSVQYSDAIQAVTITATDNASDVPFLSASTQWSLDGGDFQPGLPSGLTLTPETCAIEGSYGTCTWTLEGQVMVPAGDYVVRTLVSDEQASSSTDVTIVVAPEDAYMEYTGEAIREINKELALRATVWDSAASGYPGANPETGASATIGDISKMWIAFDLYPASSCLSDTPTTKYAQVSDGETAGDGIGTASTTFTSASEAGYCAVARLVAGYGGGVNPWYVADNAEAAAIVFYEPTGQFATGGGWIDDPGGGKGNSGFNARYNKKGNPQGHMVYVYRGLYSGVPADFVIKSNALNALMFAGTEYPISAILQGKCTIQINRSSDGALLFSEGNATFQATVVDSGENSGSGDAFSLVVYDKNGVVYKSVPTAPLQGGNIVIHQ